MVNPIVAAILSFILPGLGQILAGETKKGVIFIVIAIVLWALIIPTALLSSFISLIFSIYAAYDAYKLAQ